MTIQLFLKACIGFIIVLVIQLLSRTRYYYLSALVPLFPSMAIFSYYYVGKQGDALKLSRTIEFGMISLITYCMFLLALLLFSKKLPISVSLLAASMVWFVSAGIQVAVWNRIIH